MYVPNLGDVLKAGDRQFVLEKRLGGGRYGEVWQASNSGMSIAVKIMMSNLDQTDRVRFRSEVDVLRGIEHIGVKKNYWTKGASLVPQVLYDNVDVSDGQPSFFVESLAVGRPLDELLRERKYLNEPTAIKIMEQVCRVFVILHEDLNRSYLDFQPRNVFWDEVNEHVTIIDWNLLSPEGKPDIPSDFDHIFRLLTRTLLGETKVISPGNTPARWGSLTLSSRNILRRGINPLSSNHTVRDIWTALRDYEDWWSKPCEELLGEVGRTLKEATLAPDPNEKIHLRTKIDEILGIAREKDVEKVLETMRALITEQTAVQLPVLPREQLRDSFLSGDHDRGREIIAGIENEPLSLPDEKLEVLRWKEAFEKTAPENRLAVFESIECLIKASDNPSVVLAENVPSALPNTLKDEWTAWVKLSQFARLDREIKQGSTAEDKLILASQRLVDAVAAFERLPEQWQTLLSERIEWKDIRSRKEELTIRLDQIRTQTERRNSLDATKWNLLKSEEIIDRFVRSLTEAKTETERSEYAGKVVDFGKVSLVTGNREKAEDFIRLLERVWVKEDILPQNGKLRDELNELRARAHRVLAWHRVIDQVLLKLKNDKTELSLPELSQLIFVLAEAHKAGWEEIGNSARLIWRDVICRYSVSETAFDSIAKNLPEWFLADVEECAAIRADIERQTKELFNPEKWKRAQLQKFYEDAMQRAHSAAVKVADAGFPDGMQTIEEEAKENWRRAGGFAKKLDLVDLEEVVQITQETFEKQKSDSAIKKLEIDANQLAKTGILEKMQQAADLFLEIHSLFEKRDPEIDDSHLDIEKKLRITIEDTNKKYDLAVKCANNGEWVRTLSLIKEIQSGGVLGREEEGDIQSEILRVWRVSRDDFEELYRGAERASSRSDQDQDQLYQKIADSMAKLFGENVRDLASADLKSEMEMAKNSYKSWYEVRQSPTYNRDSLAVTAKDQYLQNNQLLSQTKYTGTYPNGNSFRRFEEIRQFFEDELTTFESRLKAGNKITDIQVNLQKAEAFLNQMKKIFEESSSKPSDVQGLINLMQKQLDDARKKFEQRNSKLSPLSKTEH